MFIHRLIASMKKYTKIHHFFLLERCNGGATESRVRMTASIDFSYLVSKW